MNGQKVEEVDDNEEDDPMMAVVRGEVMTITQDTLERGAVLVEDRLTFR